MMVSSLIVCIARDPGSVKPEEEPGSPRQDQDEEGDERQGEGLNFMDALMQNEPPENHDSEDGFSVTPVKANGERRWCRKCWAPKPERTHHW